MVYRNGVAYFERRAKLVGNELRLTVPKDKVDDFLKSLTVRDAASGKSLPISFPRKGEEQSDVVDMVIRLPAAEASEVILTYITDSPAWKPSYRIVVNDDGTVALESWAIVDNTSGENWQDVLIGVGSSSALSFRYDLWSVRDVHRQTLANTDHFAVAPPQGASTYKDGIAQGNRQVITEFSDGDINRPVTHPGRSFAMNDEDSESLALDSVAISGSRAPSAESGSDSGDATLKRHYKQQQRERKNRDTKKFTKNKSQLRNLASKLRSTKSNIVIEGLAEVGESNQDARALDRANLFRNQLIQEGVPPAQIQVRSGGAKEGRPSGVRILAEPQGEQRPNSDASKDAAPVGESHFQSGVPMTVAQGSSVMVSIVKEKTEGEIVYLYDSESSRGNNRFAFKAVRFTNPTKNTLETGPVTVYGKDSFIGEGLTDPIPPNAMAMIPFALDRQVVVERSHSNRDQISRLTRLERGVLTTEVQHIRETKLTLTNRLQEPATVYIRHSVLNGWKLVHAPKNAERLGEAHLFPITLAAGERKEISIEEATPMTKTLDLRSPAALDMIQVYVSGKSLNNKEFSDRMKSLVDEHRNIGSHQQSIQSIRSRLADYRVRMDELHIQIVSLKVVKSGGSLLKHLQSKMKDISERVQQSTISLVESQEQLMLAKIRFQDKIAELSLAPSDTK